MIDLTDSEIGKCLDFSYKVSLTTEKYYKLRNKYASTEKIIFDHAIAKMSELVVYKYLTNKSYKVSYPSFKLKYDKGEDSDIYIIKDNKEIRIHCKICRHDSPVKNSWLIEKTSIKNLSENDYFVLCRFHSPTNIEIMKIIHHADINWREPQLKSLKSKLACYLSDMN
tara:strand:+ start:1604 stop:2107 length:504 start_codon:yes stop_codon:yes gene_type:complete